MRFIGIIRITRGRNTRVTDTTADEAWEEEGRVNVDMEPDELLGVLLNTDLRDTSEEDEVTE
jgi:hypothetical protein